MWQIKELCLNQFVNLNKQPSLEHPKGSERKIQEGGNKFDSLLISSKKKTGIFEPLSFSAT
jgi:hypothetical protein